MPVEIGKRSGFSIAAVLTVLLLVSFFIAGRNTRWIWQESGPIENISALAYLLGFALCVYFYFKASKPAR